ncbi:hypothetical protein KY290_004532 [Solanum tuberosum]|uniref:Aminotransferase-like plant mobile domain-containing protein n=1 Tax=Solanum tuberosum TaxID=4113 RepID=A0ABQ7WY89_SOLTU|nr:hypothetical protein KY289_004135 [Solanum tuberosum]KAH0784934.1 hypothetical protein KY290_004532 [Solanum tuberosum]
MFEEQDKVEEVSSLRQSLDNMKKEIRALCKRAQDLKVLSTPTEDEVEGSKLATLFAIQEFDARFDVDLTNNLGQKKEHLEAMPKYHHANIATTLPSLGRCIIQGEIQWGNTMTVEESIITFQGIGSEPVIYLVGIYDAVYVSLFTYDRNSNILQAFCEAWCPKTNTLFTYAGELSIYLWDLHILGGLPIWGSLYEEIVPEARNLWVPMKRGQNTFLGLVNICLRHFIFGGVNQEVSFSKWISFWCKKPQRYEATPPREEKKYACPESTHNPSGGLPDTTRRRILRHHNEKNLMKPPPVTQVEKGLPNVSCYEVKDDLGYEAHKHPSPVMSIFDGKRVILDA